MGLFGGWSQKPQVGLGNTSWPQIAREADLGIERLSALFSYCSFMLRPWMESLVKPMTREARDAIRERQALGNKELVKVTISKARKRQVSES